MSDDYLKIINGLSHISVRERGIALELNSISNKDIKEVLDPVFLRTKEEWMNDIREYESRKEDGIFTYFIGISREQRDLLDCISKKHNKKVLCYSGIPKEKHIKRYCYSNGPFEFLADLRDSEMAIVSSFHGLAFSILMNKNFYVLKPQSDKRNRMDNLLRTFNLEDRMIESEGDIEKMTSENIDYARINEKISTLREESLNWLKNAIEN